MAASNGQATKEREQEQKLWQALWAARDALVAHYEPWLRRVVGRYLQNVPPSEDHEAITQEARIGLLQAIARYDGSTRFTTYAQHRLIGAARDSRRDMDRLSRQTRKHLAEGAAEGTVEPPQVVSLERLQCALDESGRRPLPALALPDEPGQLERDDSFRELCRGLGLREQTLLYLYYAQEQPLRAIGQMLRLSESRCSQLHSALLEQLRERMARDGFRVGAGTKHRRRARRA